MDSFPFTNGRPKATKKSEAHVILTTLMQDYLQLVAFSGHEKVLLDINGNNSIQLRSPTLVTVHITKFDDLHRQKTRGKRALFSLRYSFHCKLKMKYENMPSDAICKYVSVRYSLLFALYLEKFGSDGKALHCLQKIFLQQH